MMVTKRLILFYICLISLFLASMFLSFGIFEKYVFN